MEETGSRIGMVLKIFWQVTQTILLAQAKYTPRQTGIMGLPFMCYHNSTKTHFYQVSFCLP